VSSAKIFGLRGATVTAVCFVHDYVEVHFGERVVRALSDPLVSVGSREVAFPCPGARDALCGLIGTQLVDVELDSLLELRMKFSRGSSVCVPLDQARRENPEALHFVPGVDQPIEVW